MVVLIEHRGGIVAMADGISGIVASPKKPKAVCCIQLA